MKRIFTIILFLCPFITIGQPGKFGLLNKDLNLDTLFVFLELSNAIDQVLQEELMVRFDTVVSVFNEEEKSFIVIIDTSQNNRSIHFLVGSIKYVDLKRNIWTTGLNVALIGANILILPYFPPVIPFYFMPAAVSRVDIKSSEDLFAKSSRFFINPNGYWAKQEKQTLRFKKKFSKTFYKCLLNFDKQNQKNNKIKSG